MLYHRLRHRWNKPNMCNFTNLVSFQSKIFMTFKEFACSIISEGASHYVPVSWHTPTCSHKNHKSLLAKGKTEIKSILQGTEPICNIYLNQNSYQAFFPQKINIPSLTDWAAKCWMDNIRSAWSWNRDFPDGKPISKW